MSDSLVIIPTYNEKDNIERIIRKVFSLELDFHILIVEDNYLNIQTTLNTLEPYHMKCDVANDGEEGVLMGTQYKYDIIFMDISLPVYNGIIVNKQIRIRYPEAIIIALSSFDKREILEKDDTVVFNDFLKKPLEEEELSKCLRRLNM